ncbi:hypothetical protein TH66_20645 [Carbonactinospora thermoautotrophica]|uniref:Uncharacterized protein n=1 Tax=Carbonactinospora thermoautotrophica TaxID=1469144 RepID=A0A132NB77_9ACTN|nr:hypothetical protein [Carbonactinospora thermoautotrophica]KWW97840.1 hypothetical protein TH66_20645 [Carbonactinospora thermoautotrophica]KWX07409.1 hypothetical protein TR74_18875 [Carbonactinospora thermoautotrophica]
MAHVLRRPRISREVLEDLGFRGDGRRHPRENALTASTIVLAVVALVCATNQTLHIPGSWAGLAGMVLGFSTQLISASTAQRMLIVPALGASFVGLYLNMFNGGLW